jgi:hypothetical protein
MNFSFSNDDNIYDDSLIDLDLEEDNGLDFNLLFRLDIKL